MSNPAISKLWAALTAVFPGKSVVRPVSMVLLLIAPATAQNFTNTAARLAIEPQVEGLGLRIVGDAGVFYELRVATELGQWTNLDGRISNDTNELHWTDAQGTKFFQLLGDDQMRFPAWRDFVEQKLTFNFQPARRGGTFTVQTYADGMLWGSAQGSVENWADSTGTVWLEDGGPSPVDGYPYHEFVSHFTWTPPESGAVPYSRVFRKRQRGRSTYRGHWGTNGIVLHQHGIYGSAVQPLIDLTQHAVFSNSIPLVAQNDLNAMPLTAASNPPALFGPDDWTKLKFLLLTNAALTHLHYYGSGSLSHLGSAEQPEERITTALLNSSPRLATNLLTYVALDGCVTGDGDLLGYLIGYKRTWTEESIYHRQGGSWYCFGWGWSAGKTNFTNELHFQFIRDFYANMAAGFSYRESYERARLLPDGTENIESRHFKPVGCFDCYFPQ